MSERRVTKYSLPVDGFCESTHEVFEFQGCVFHGCGKCNTNRDSNGNLKELNCFGKNIQELQKSTQEKSKNWRRKDLQFTKFMNVNGKRC